MSTKVEVTETKEGTIIQDSTNTTAIKAVVDSNGKCTSILENVYKERYNDQTNYNELLTQLRLDNSRLGDKIQELKSTQDKIIIVDRTGWSETKVVADVKSDSFRKLLDKAANNEVERLENELAQVKKQNIDLENRSKIAIAEANADARCFEEELEAARKKHRMTLQDKEKEHNVRIRDFIGAEAEQRAIYEENLRGLKIELVLLGKKLTKLSNKFNKFGKFLFGKTTKSLTNLINDLRWELATNIETSSKPI